MITPESESVYKEISKLIPTLRHLAAIDVNETQCQELVKVLDDLTEYAMPTIDCFLSLNSLCHLEGEQDEPHKQNQKILYNTG